MGLVKFLHLKKYDKHSFFLGDADEGRHRVNHK